MKKPIYYAIARARWHTPHMGYAVLAVTSEGPRGRINGRYTTDNHPTHMNKRDLLPLRFDTADKAGDKITAIRAASDAWQPALKAAHAETRRLYDEQEKAIQEAINAK